MDHGNAIGYVQNHPDSDRLRILYEVASGSYEPLRTSHCHAANESGRFGVSSYV